MKVDLDELQRWDDRICEVVAAYGLDCYTQEFEVCDHNEMIGYMAYSGMPSHYPHWSYGKSFEKTKTLYRHGATGLPYEMVINSDPCLAYLMGDNSLCLNVLTIAHVYGHNDFFKNNFTFSTTRAEHTLSSFKSHADRVRTYVEDPSIGQERVESVLDAAHALSLQCRRDMVIRKLSREEQVDRAFDSSLPREDPNSSMHQREEYEAPDLHRVPLEPEADLLLFVRDNNPFLDDWAKDLLTIVHEEAQYFIPQIETKIMNEGWASYWHYNIMRNVGLPQEMELEFMVNHNQVLQPHPGGLNPYHLGFMIWQDIYRQHEGDEAPDHSKPTAGKDAIFAARDSERDRSFLRRFLSKDLMRKLGMFEWGEKKGDYVVTEVADDQGWEEIKQTMIGNVGMATIPVIKIVDSDYEGNRHLLMRHDYEGRELNLENAEKTLAYMHHLWGRTVFLESVVTGKPTLLVYNEDGLSTRKPG